VLALALLLSLPPLMRTFRHPPARPRLVSLRAIEPRYSVHGWNVRLRRRAHEFSRLSGASRGGFKLTGSGSAVVRTPGFYATRSRHLVVVGGRRQLLRADQDGRLRIALRLGPANRFQQFSPEEKANPSRFHRVSVTVKPAG
jgi:hypothetical protein